MFLANENFPRPSIMRLRDKGFSVVSIAETSPGIPDDEVIQIAVKSQLIILTFDRDYGELIFRYAQENPPAVVYFREKSNTPYFAGESLIKLLLHGEINLTNAFTVIERTGIRQRFYKK